MDRIFFLLYRGRGYLLLQHVECNCNIRLIDGISLTVPFFPVKVLPNALHIAILFQWLYIPANRRVHRTQFPIESNRPRRGRPACLDRFQRLVGANGFTCHRWPNRALHFLLGTIRYLIPQTCARKDATRSSLGRHAEI